MDVESVAWDITASHSGSTGVFYVGTGDGNICEALIVNKKCKKFGAVRASRIAPPDLFFSPIQRSHSISFTIAHEYKIMSPNMNSINSNNNRKQPQPLFCSTCRLLPTS